MMQISEYVATITLGKCSETKKDKCSSLEI